MANAATMQGNDDGRGSAFKALRQHIKRALRIGDPAVGAVRWADLRRTVPIGRRWGFDRGTPVDRYYIEQFLRERSADVAGNVLEVKDATYSTQFGGGRVTQSAVLDVDVDNPGATIVTDLNNAVELPTGAFDCIILTQTLQFIYDYSSAIHHLARSLAPGGALLLTVPGITRVPSSHSGNWYWSFTRDSVRRILGEHFPSSLVDVASRGNILAATAFLHGLAAEELDREELEQNDPEFPLIIMARAEQRVSE
jgi:SAM-dependent methyltransferase